MKKGDRRIEMEHLKRRKENKEGDRESIKENGKKKRKQENGNGACRTEKGERSTHLTENGDMWNIPEFNSDIDSEQWDLK
ncbi:Hypothetical predicted protein [Mytilus galloprovincialis]|uniref:Uncharacterized protein n=1 Tax=Mytilus galloprovincialis TaxID=29158 RepID=A0A8B6CRL0_MYTGA|nr:Hypothetical predicted protein [Mytilus galloprovincialis]